MIFIRLKIGIDIDETLNNMLEAIIPMYNKKYNDSISIDQITQYELKPLLKPECLNLFEEFATDELIEGLAISCAAKEAVCELAKYNDIYFVTAGHPYTMKARDKWLTKHFPFYKSKMLLGCCEKHLLHLDVLIDDHVDNLIGGSYMGILLDKPWNRSCPEHIYGINRVSDWSEVLGLI